MPIPFLLAGVETLAAQPTALHNPFDGSWIADVCQAEASHVETACAAAERSFSITRTLPAWRREEILRRMADLMKARSEDFAQIIVKECGKAIRDSRGEVGRAIGTLLVAAEEAKRVPAGMLPLDWNKGNDGRAAMIRRVPIGPVLGITPFNFPLNLVVHKLAPAIASGNPIVIKPAPQTPLSALALGKLAVEAGWPAEAISVLPCPNEVAALLLADARLKKLSFTGSDKVGWQLKAASGKKHVTLELGGNAAVIVHSDGDLELAAQRIVAGGFALAGQSCISVQRVLVEQAVFGQVLAQVLELTQKLETGDPAREETSVGPMISEAAAMRAKGWIDKAIASGAKLHCGGQRTGALLTPAVLTDVAKESELNCEEVFAPIVVLEAYDTFEQALARVNESRYGLQAGVFTSDWRRIARAYAVIDAGAILIDEVPTWRADHMPYGGVKDSGLGREGVASAIEAMTEPKLLVLKF